MIGDYANLTDSQREAIRRFIENVYSRAESIMEKSLKLEGAHYAAIREELKELERQAKK